MNHSIRHIQMHALTDAHRIWAEIAGDNRKNKHRRVPTLLIEEEIYGSKAGVVAAVGGVGGGGGSRSRWW